MGNILPGLILQIFPSWEQVFYIFGGIGWMWWLCWCWFVSPSPGTHPFIEEEEANYILDSLRSESQMVHVIIDLYSKQKDHWSPYNRVGME